MTTTLIDKRLYQARILVVTAKQERGFTVKQILRSVTDDVFLSTSLYEAANLAKNNLPHLILCDIELPDGSIYDLAQKMNPLPDTASIKVFAIGAPKSMNDADKMQQKSIKSMNLPSLEAKIFMEKFNVILLDLGFSSPFAIDVVPAEQNCKLAFAGTKIGSIPGWSFFQTSLIKIDSSNIQLSFDDNEATILATQQIEDLSSATTPSRNPISITDVYAAWRNAHCEIIYEKQIEADEFKQFMVRRGCVKVSTRTWREYVTELMRTQSQPTLTIMLTIPSPEEKAMLEKIPHRKELFVLNLAADPFTAEGINNIWHLPRPFALSAFANVINAAFSIKKIASMRQLETKDLNISDPKTATAFPAKLLKLDETGGIVETAVMPRLLSEMKFSGRLPDRIWQSSTCMRARSIRYQPDRAIFQIRFTTEKTNLSTEKYLAHLKKCI